MFELTVGWAGKALLPRRQEPRPGWEDGREKMGPALRQTPKRFCVCYADFFALWGTGFAPVFLASFAFSFAANSCLTCRAMASTSTL